MGRPRNLRCDSCGQAFELQQTDIRIRQDPEDKERTYSYFRCPACMRYYLIGVRDRALQRMIRTPSITTRMRRDYADWLKKKYADRFEALMAEKGAEK